MQCSEKCMGIWGIGMRMKNEAKDFKTLKYWVFLRQDTPCLQHVHSSSAFLLVDGILYTLHFHSLE